MYGKETAAPAPPAETEEVAEETPEETTATLPSGLFAGGVKKGDTITLRVVNVFDGEVEVVAAAAAEGEGEPGMMEEMPADAELDQMAQA